MWSWMSRHSGQCCHQPLSPAPLPLPQARLVGGEVIPGMVTTAAVVGALMCLEVYKVVAGRPRPALRHSFCNLTIPLMLHAEPRAAVKTEVSHLPPLGLPRDVSNNGVGRCYAARWQPVQARPWCGPCGTALRWTGGRE